MQIQVQTNINYDEYELQTWKAEWGSITNTRSPVKGAQHRSHRPSGVEVLLVHSLVLIMSTVEVMNIIYILIGSLDDRQKYVCHSCHG